MTTATNDHISSHHDFLGQRPQHSHVAGFNVTEARGSISGSAALAADAMRARQRDWEATNAMQDWSRQALVKFALTIRRGIAAWINNEWRLCGQNRLCARHAHAARRINAPCMAYHF